MKRYFLEADAATADEVAGSLWAKVELSRDDEKLVLAQYQLYVELADRVSARRAHANTFFLTLNTAVFTLIGAFWSAPPDATPWFGLFPLIILVVQCLVWFWTIRSYRQLNSGKWAVVGAFEQRLPASPWWRAEWTALGEGSDPRRYWPLSHVEQWVPILFAAAYVGGFVVLAAM